MVEFLLFISPVFPTTHCFMLLYTCREALHAERNRTDRTRSQVFEAAVSVANPANLHREPLAVQLTPPVAFDARAL